MVPPARVTGNPGIETEQEKFPVEIENETICRDNTRVEVEEANKKKKYTGVVSGVMKMSKICRNKLGSCTEERLKETKCGKTDISN